jgi:hypothetical protein
MAVVQTQESSSPQLGVPLVAETVRGEPKREKREALSVCGETNLGHSAPWTCAGYLLVRHSVLLPTSVALSPLCVQLIQTNPH